MGDPAQATRTIRRQRILLVLTSAAAVVAVAVLIASTLVRSPAQHALDQQPPPPSNITAEVVEKVLQQIVITRGAVEAARSIDVVPTANGADKVIVTSLPVDAGDPVKQGDLLATIAGRPLIALGGDAPLYRDLRPGTTGPDVVMVQKSLITLKLLKGEPSGQFDGDTQAAVKKLYKQLKVTPLATADLDPEETARLTAARRAVVEAQRQYDDAVAARENSAGEARDDAQRDVNRAWEDLQLAETELAALLATTGTVLPAGEVVAVPSFPASILTVDARPGSDLADTEDGLLMTISVGDLIVTGLLAEGDHSVAAEGASVRIIDETQQDEIEGTLVKVGEFDPAPDTGAAGYPFTIEPRKRFPADWNGKPVRVDILVAETPAPVLVVPVTAIRGLPDGSSIVRIVDSDGAEGGVREVPVDVGLVAQGEAEISSTDPSLRAGVKVLVEG